MVDGSEILRKMLASEVRGDLLVLFHKNPGLIDTIDGVARRIGRTSSLIEIDLRDLVNIGILKTKRIGKSEAIFLDRAKDKEIQESLANYLKNFRHGG
ncbi:MAG: hypothetical protein HYU39_01470 [Thaumarchaeota archaeon]|nr:hypothetical protein [Nitrososphaerota archaeon]